MIIIKARKMIFKSNKPTCMFNNKIHSLVWVPLVVTLFATSCISSKKVTYVNDLPQGSIQPDSSALFKSIDTFRAVIQKNDLLWITVGGTNLNDLTSINSASGFGSGGSANPSTSTGTNSTIGYLVEADGAIKISFLGKVQAEGLTRMKLEDKITDLLKDYTKNPVVNVRFLNYSFSILGEVVKGGKFQMPTERVTILEALSMAGDLTILAKRDNLLLIRESEGQRTFARLNLLSKDIFTSPYYYIKANDVIYVEPVTTKFINRTGLPQYLSLAAVGVSLILTIINVSRK
jgi:polysaccharide biosynthesis/export protein